LRRLLRDGTRVRRRGRRDLGKLVTIDGHPLRLRLRQGSVTKRSDDVNVRHGRYGSDRCRLIRNDDRRRALDRDDLAALDALGRALLRRAGEHGEEQRS
jgi:hypothetical protein